MPPTDQGVWEPIAILREDRCFGVINGPHLSFVFSPEWNRQRPHNQKKNADYRRVGRRHEPPASIDEWEGHPVRLNESDTEVGVLGEVTEWGIVVHYPKLIRLPSRDKKHSEAERQVHDLHRSLVPEGYHPPYEEGARRILQRQVEQVRQAGGTVAEAHLRAGTPTDEILDLVEELRPGLLVAGSRGLGPIKHLILGSVSEALVHHNHAMTP